jgi:hypothetical protein
MLFFINGKIIEGVKLNQHGIPIIPKEQLLDDKDYSSSLWPFIQIPSIKPYSRVKCRIGYWDQEQLTITDSAIVLGNVSIISITFYFEKEQVREWSGGYQYDKDQYKLFYHYEISLELVSNDYTCCYTFNSDDYLEINYGRRESPKLRTMNKLFKSVIPMLDDFVSKGFSIDMLNKCYVQSCFPLKGDNFISHNYFHDYNWFKQIIYSAHIKHADGTYFLEFGKGLMPFVNHHVAEVISDILGVRFLRESNDRYIYGIVTKLLKDINNDDSLLLPYCMATLFFNAEKYYSTETANKELLLAVSSDINEPITTKKLLDMFKPTVDVVKMFDFISNLKAEHKIRGQYRAGRDDHECEYKKISFSLKGNYTPSNNLINLINSTLEIKLEFKDADNFKYDPQPSQYYFTEIIESGYVPWLARDEDRGSEEFQKTSLKKLCNKVYQIYKTNEEEFYNLL